MIVLKSWIENCFSDEAANTQWDGSKNDTDIPYPGQSMRIGEWRRSISYEKTECNAPLATAMTECSGLPKVKVQEAWKFKKMEPASDELLPMVLAASRLEA